MQDELDDEGLTNALNLVVGAIHPAMRAIFHSAAIDAWLIGDMTGALSLPMADEMMRTVK